MCKLVALGLLALSMGFFANPAFAGNVEDCESLKQSGEKSLYGLCVAWHNADPEAKDGLAEKFFDRAGYPVPGSEDPEPPPADFTCLCWDDVTFASICALGAPESVLSFPEITIVTFDGLIEFTTDTYASDSFGPGCAHTILDDGTGEQYIYDVMGGLTEEQALDCMSEVLEISTLYNSGGCEGL
jgi:hypothetical protein